MQISRREQGLDQESSVFEHKIIEAILNSNREAVAAVDHGYLESGGNHVDVSHDT